MFWVLLMSALVEADIYMQSPCGSNNRLDGQNRDRNNANRLFDSQNNNRGGYNVGNVYWLGETKINFKWTAQHGCGQGNLNCNIILQIMCDNRTRDGTTTKTIPDNPIECYNWDCDTDVRYGRHESFDSYQTCKNTMRNMNLFLGSQNLKGKTAIYTRQNPNGARRGYECPEERDYYPYWRPTNWVDVAYFTDNYPAACDAVAEKSENVETRYYCEIRREYLYMKEALKNRQIPITRKECEDFLVYVPKKVQKLDTEGKPVLDGNNEPIWEVAKASNGQKIMEERFAGVWKRASYSSDRNRIARVIGAPKCIKTQWSRDNHHGNVEGGYFAGYNWTVPDINVDGCVFRLRYNMSTVDVPSMFDDLSSEAVEDLTGRYYVGEALGFNKSEIEMNGYYFKNNPQVAPFYGYASGEPTNPNFQITENNEKKELKFQLAVNTAQYGRTFEDRTHRFAVKKRPGRLLNTVIHNLNVRGKRGNIVQTYPATEYSFQPEVLETGVGDYIAFQWVGSNTNPNNNAGQGRQGTDRHNIAPLAAMRYFETGMPKETSASETRYGQWGRSYPADLRSGSEGHVPFLGLELPVLQKLASLIGLNTNGGELSELDDSGTWVDGGIWKITMPGIFNYLCTRNNNFSNRSQKGQIQVKPQGKKARVAQASHSGAVVAGEGVVLEVGEGADDSAEFSFLIVGKATDEGYCNPCASNYVKVSDLPQSKTGNKLTISYEEKTAWDPVVIRTDADAAITSENWQEVEDAVCEEGSCTLPASKGLFVVDHKLGAGAIVGIVLACLVCVAAVGFVIWRLKK